MGQNIFMGPEEKLGRNRYVIAIGDHPHFETTRVLKVFKEFVKYFCCLLNLVINSFDFGMGEKFGLVRKMF